MCKLTLETMSGRYQHTKYRVQAWYRGSYSFTSYYISCFVKLLQVIAFTAAHLLHALSIECTSYTAMFGRRTFSARVPHSYGQCNDIPAYKNAVEGHTA